MVWSMLKSKNIQKELLAEAVQCSVYVQNCCPHTKLLDQTPQEAWSGIKPTISHFKVFGSVAYAHVPDQRRTKLDDKSKKYVFIAYDEKIKDYKLFDPTNKKVIVSRDVNVNEEISWDWINQNVGSFEKQPDHEPQNLIYVPQTTYERDEMHFVCLLADSESFTFEEAIRDKKWKDLWMKKLPQSKEIKCGIWWNFQRDISPFENGDDKAAHFSSGANEVANLSNGREICVFEWCAPGRSVRGATTRIDESREGDTSIQTEQGTLRAKTSSASMEHPHRFVSQKEQLFAVSIRTCIVCKE
ncbi:retrovirus-related pol polyprotein from transposon TNT 1-94 [Tanacetum coccineum]